MINNIDFLKVPLAKNKTLQTSLSSTSNCLVASMDDVRLLWHQKYDHLNFKSLKLNSLKKMVFGFPNIQIPKELCDEVNNQENLLILLHSIK